MMSKILLISLVISFLLFQSLFSLNNVRADIVDEQRGLIAKAPCIIMPTNTTYSSNELTLNVSFQAAVYGNLNYSMTYSLDGKENQTVPLSVHYFGFINQSQNYIDGQIKLQTLSESSHGVTVFLKAMSTVNVNNRVITKTYSDSQTVYFTITIAGHPTPSVAEFSWLTILPLLLASPIALAIVRKRLQRNV